MVPDQEQGTFAQRHAVLVGWACLGACVVLMIGSLWLFFVYGPLWLLAGTFGVIAVTRKRRFAGIALLLAFIVIPPPIWVVLTIYRGVEAADHGIGAVQKEVVRLRGERHDPTIEDKIRLGLLPEKIDPALGLWRVTLWDGSRDAATFTSIPGGFERCDAQAFIFWVKPGHGEEGDRVYEIAGDGKRGVWHGGGAGGSGWFEMDARPDAAGAQEIPFRWNEDGSADAPKAGCFNR